MSQQSEAIRRYIAVIRRSADLMEAQLNLMENSSGIVDSIVEQVPVKATLTESSLAVRQQHVKDMMAIPNWPEAAPSFLASTQSSDKDDRNRAAAILDMSAILDVDGKNFLDFGCGESWAAGEALRRGANAAVGYDIVPNDKWGKMSGPEFVSNFSQVKKGFFDIVLLWDVLDHCQDVDDVIEKVKMCLRDQATVYVRCHPWTSRHATHLYKQGLNKAYIHMFLRWNEIKEVIQQEPIFTRVEKNPLESYRWWFRDFKVIKEIVGLEDVPEFFHAKPFKELLQKEQQVEDVDDFLDKMKIQFVNYQLQLK